MGDGLCGHGSGRRRPTGAGGEAGGTNTGGDGWSLWLPSRGGETLTLRLWVLFFLYRVRNTGRGYIGEDILGELAIWPLEVPADQEVGSVTWSSRERVAVLQQGLTGKPVLILETQTPSSR